MQPAKQQVVDLIHDYQAAVYQAVALLNAKSAQDKGFQRYQQSPGVWAGYLDNEQRISYYFHGAGCWIKTPVFTVDFDYALEGGCTGLDLWFLVDFLKRNPTIQAKYPLLTNGEQVEQALQDLVVDGVLTRYVYSEYDERYYVTATIGQPNVPMVTLYNPDEELAD
jgi:hypothetical protein